MGNGDFSRIDRALLQSVTRRAVIYLDHNATAPLRPEAMAAIAEAVQRAGNPASLHGAGQAARKTLEAASAAMLQILGAEGARLLWTAGGTEANTLALLGLARSRRRLAGCHRVLLSAVEHPCVQAAAGQLAREGFVVEVLPVDASGHVPLDAPGWGEDVAVAALMLANNETGVIQPLARWAALARQFAVPLHTDAVQAVGKMPVDFGSLGVTSLALAGHKLGGPRGIGALVLAPDVPIEPLWAGGGQQDGLRSGSQPVALAVGLAAALTAATAELSPPRALPLRQRLEELCEAVPEAFVVAKTSARLPNTVAVGFRGVAATTLMGLLDEAGVMVSTGAACHSATSSPSPVLLAMGVPSEQAACVVRLSVGWTTSLAEVEQAGTAIVHAVQQARRLD